MSYRIGIDIGGTFTDFALLNLENGRVSTYKQLTTPARPAEAVLSGLDVLFGRDNIQSQRVDAVIHGTTLITNAVIERKGSTVGMVTTAGFRDVIDMGLESRYDMFDLRINYPRPLVSRRNRCEISERVLYDGSVEKSLDPDQVKMAIRSLVEEQKIEALAVCLLHSYARPDHERRIRDIAIELYPSLYVSLSSDVYPDIREYPRWTTTCINAYTQPVFDRYLREIENGLKQRSISAPLFIMTSNGGTVTPSTARMFPVRALESGPAAGVLMSALHGRNLHQANLLSFDMGGTTAKGALVNNGEALKRYEIEVARMHGFKQGSGLIAKIPVIDMIEIGSGGGSIASLDSRALLAVGPQSAGADPGPACYNLGGKEATLTDANLILGYLDEGSLLGGNFQVVMNKAVEAVEKNISRKLDLTLARSAWGIHDIINEGIAKAFRIHASERGFDYRDSSMVAFGGSGPIHALEVARKLRIPQVIFPVGAGVMSALGLLASPLSFEEVQFKHVFLEELDYKTFEENFRRLKQKVSMTLVASGVPVDQIHFNYVLDMRYSGQGYTIEVAIPEVETLRSIFPTMKRLFEEQYSTVYSQVDLKSSIEITTWKVNASGPVPPFPSGYKTWKDGSNPSKTKNTTRKVYFRVTDEYIDTTVLKRPSIEPGVTLQGPLIIEESETTVVVPPDYAVNTDNDLNLVAQLKSID